MRKFYEKFREHNFYILLRLCESYLRLLLRNQCNQNFNIKQKESRIEAKIYFYFLQLNAAFRSSHPS